jgi:hypothetical protein
MFIQVKVIIYVTKDHGTIRQPVRTIVPLLRLAASKASMRISHRKVYNKVCIGFSGRKSTYTISIIGYRNKADSTMYRIELSGAI